MIAEDVADKIESIDLFDGHDGSATVYIEFTDGSSHTINGNLTQEWDYDENDKPVRT